MMIIASDLCGKLEVKDGQLSPSQVFRRNREDNGKIRLITRLIMYFCVDVARKLCLWHVERSAMLRR
jgi:hypothetical protein